MRRITIIALALDIHVFWLHPEAYGVIEHPTRKVCRMHSDFINAFVEEVQCPGSHTSAGSLSFKKLVIGGSEWGSNPAPTLY